MEWSGTTNSLESLPGLGNDHSAGLTAWAWFRFFVGRAFRIDLSLMLNFLFIGSRTTPEEPLTNGKAFGPQTITEHAVVTNANQALWQYMKQKTSNELNAVQAHGSARASVTVVLPAERHFVAVHVE